jgi:N-acetylglucosamine-6-phosphate deacetylase
MRKPMTVLRGRIVTPTSELPDGVVVMTDRIQWVGAAAEAGVDVPPTDVTVVPGLIDLHCHGGGGASFPDAPDGAHARRAIDEHRAHGTTGLIASLVTAPPDALLRDCELLAELADDGDLLGIHLEGPFLSPARCGAQDPRSMLLGDPGLVRDLAHAARGHLVTMTVAPEIMGVTGPGGVVRAIVKAGAVPSFGHTDAPSQVMAVALTDARTALARGGRSGLPTVTHLFNGMPGLHHRGPGPVAAALAAAARGEAVVEVIGDGVHLAPTTVATVFDLVPDGAVALVTDAIAVAGMPDGDYLLGSARVTVVGGIARLTGTDTLAGSAAHLLDVVRVTVGVGVPLVRAVRAASTTPAAVLGCTDRGALEVGLRADVVVLDKGLHPLEVYVAGRRI